MFIRRTDISRAIRRLENQELFGAARKIVRKNTKTDTYGVGGMLYRNLISVLYQAPVPKHDYDFLVMGEVRKEYLPLGWHWKDEDIRPRPIAYLGSGIGGAPRKVPSRLSATAVHVSGLKVDLISILDIMKQQNSRKLSVEVYFNAVPLDIQRIAYNWDDGRLWGEGIFAIKKRTVKINNYRAFDIYRNPVNINQYGSEKVSTLPGFKFISGSGEKHKCYCFPDDAIMLWNRGCQCGGI